MDAVKFLEECRRMINLGESVPLTDCNVAAEEVVANVELWSKNNPRKTRQDVFLEQWHYATIGDDDALMILPCHVDKTLSGDCAVGSCDYCRREFWMQEVE